MAPNDTPRGLATELSQAITELEASLERTAEAVAKIKDIAPRIAAVNSLLDELESVIRSGRQHFGGQQIEPPASIARPTLVVPNSTAHTPVARTAQPIPPRQLEETPPQRIERDEPQAAQATPAPQAALMQTPEREDARPQAPSDEALISFRLEFHSQPGPLDLRAVDEAVGDHPAVRDVALLDYDGRRATLKVWIAAPSSPAEVQAALIERAPDLFGTENDVSILALEDAA